MEQGGRMNFERIAIGLEELSWQYPESPPSFQQTIGENDISANYDVDRK